MPANTLLLTLMATDDKPFSKEIVEANNKLLLEYLDKLKKGTTDFDVVKSICNMCNYIYGFNKNKLIGSDITQEHEKAAAVLRKLSNAKPWKISEEDCSIIEDMIFYWKEILTQCSENLVRQIQHEIHFKTPQAKQLRSIERRMVHRRKATKPPFSRKKK